jgi:hypothetical protein
MTSWAKFGAESGAFELEILLDDEGERTGGLGLSLASFIQRVVVGSNASLKDAGLLPGLQQTETGLQVHPALATLDAIVEHEAFRSIDGHGQSEPLHAFGVPVDDGAALRQWRVFDEGCGKFNAHSIGSDSVETQQRSRERYSTDDDRSERKPIGFAHIYGARRLPEKTVVNQRAMKVAFIQQMEYVAETVFLATLVLWRR